ncbi:hypothetical protein RUM43_008737 [Polyplax serrata]|uniref:Uncharacterized protein n=1 Tax=Polyplax serrata TaxID=468196 RepID=A0AAN8NNX1_POLSC
MDLQHAKFIIFKGWFMSRQLANLSRYLLGPNGVKLCTSHTATVALAHATNSTPRWTKILVDAFQRRDGKSSRKLKKQTTLTTSCGSIEKSPTGSASTTLASTPGTTTTTAFLPLDYHNLNKQRQQTGKSDFKVRGNTDCYYYSCMIETGGSGSQQRNKRLSDFSPDRHSFSKAVTSFKNSSLMKSVRSESRRNESDYFENPQRTLDHSITQKLFDDMGNIAGSNENNVSYYANQGANFNKVDKGRGAPFTGDEGQTYADGTYKGSYQDRENDFLCDDIGHYKSNRRVAPIYMQNPYEPNSIDRMEI